MNALAIPAHQITEQLTLREWIKLCAWVDETYGKKVAASMQRGAWGLSPDSFSVGERKLEVKFDVLGIERCEDGMTIRASVERIGVVSVKL